MDLPQDSKLIRVIYEYENGKQYEAVGQAVENLTENIESASTIYTLHSGVFKEIDWKLIKQRSDK